MIDECSWCCSSDVLWSCDCGSTSACLDHLDDSDCDVCGETPDS